MANLQKNTARYPVQYLLFTWWSNLNYLLAGSQAYLKMPVLSSGSWNNVYFTPSRIEIQESQSNTSNGPVFEFSLNAFLPGNFPELSRMLSPYTGKPHLVMLVLQNGQRVMLGNEHIGASFRYQQSNSALGASLTWEMSDIQSIQEVEWIQQFQINAQGMLQQMWGDDNTYSLNQQGRFSVIGPDSKHIYIDETKLVQE